MAKIRTHYVSAPCPVCIKDFRLDLQQMRKTLMSLRRQLVPEHETEEHETVYLRHMHDTMQSNKTNKHVIFSPLQDSIHKTFVFTKCSHYAYCWYDTYIIIMYLSLHHGTLSFNVHIKFAEVHRWCLRCSHFHVEFIKQLCTPGILILHVDDRLLHMQCWVLGFQKTKSFKENTDRKF